MYLIVRIVQHCILEKRLSESKFFGFLVSCDILCPKYAYNVYTHVVFVCVYGEKKRRKKKTAS